MLAASVVGGAKINCDTEDACGENGAAGWCEVDGLVHFGCGVVVWLLRKISAIWREIKKTEGDRRVTFVDRVLE